MFEGVIIYYLFLCNNNYGWKVEKGIDVLLVFEVFEQVFYKQFDVLVFIVFDSDYVFFICKVNFWGIRVMVFLWDFEYIDDYGN